MRWSSLSVRGLLGAALVAALLPLGLAAPAGAATGTCSGTPVQKLWNGVDLKATAATLCPGDTLLIAPGTYNIGYVRIYNASIYPGSGIRSGTATAPITITAADPSNPPLIQGGLQFTKAHYWRLENLKLQGTVATRPTLYMIDGVGWVVQGCDIWGARYTNALANVVIGGGGGQPSKFLFRWNRVHGAARSTRVDTTDHNIYVNFHGAAGSGGVITRNRIWDAPHGAGIKLGDGGAYNALGPWFVTVSMNTLYANGRQILLHGKVASNRIYGNLLVKATQRFVTDTRTTQIYIHDVTGTRNTFSYNYAFASTMFTYDPKKRGTYLYNKLFNTSGYDPLFTVKDGQLLYPTNPRVAAYGTFGTGRFG